MIVAIIIAVLTGLGVCLSVLLKPEIKIGKINIGTYWLVALVGAIAVMVSGVVPLSEIVAGLTADRSVNPLKILALFITMTFLSVFLDELGAFEFLAEKAIEKGGESQVKLFFTLYVTVALLTVFTSNDVIVLTFTPFICCFARKAGVNPVPYLFAEFFAANTWSTFLIIGNPTNIYLATAAGLNFCRYIAVMALPTACAGAVSLFITFLIFRKKLSQKICVCKSESKIKDKVLTLIAAAHLVLCVILLSVSGFLGVEMWLITCVFAASLVIVSCVYLAAKKSGFGVLFKAVKRLPYSLLPFVLSMFVVVLALSYTGATDKFAEILSKTNSVFSVGISSFLVANLINNIPMSVLYGSVLSSPVFAAAESLKGVYAAIIGSNLCAYFTPLGALAGIMWLSILKKEGVNVGFKKFVAYGASVSVPSLLVALCALALIL